MVASDASDEEGSSSLGYEGLGGPPKRTRTFAEPGDLELAELYRRVARDGYIELQCIEEKTTSSAGLEERNDTSTATDDFKINQLLDKTKEAKVYETLLYYCSKVSEWHHLMFQGDSSSS